MRVCPKVQGKKELQQDEINERKREEYQIDEKILEGHRDGEVFLE